MKDKEGNELTFKEYMQRWKEGIEGLTPLQATKTQFNSTNIMLIGIVAGFIISILNPKTLWWVALILGGAFGNTAVQWLGLYQKKKILGNLEKEMEEFEDEPVEELNKVKGE